MAVATSTALAYAAAAAAVAGAGISYKAGQDAADAQEESSKIQKNQAKIQEDVKRREAVRQERIRRSQIQQRAENTGASFSSGEFGSIGALGSLTATNIASSLQADRTTDALAGISSDISDANRRQATAGAVSSLAGTVFQGLGGVTSLASGTTANPAAGTNLQGQKNPLLNNPAYVRRM